MGSRDTGICLNTNSAESSAVHGHHPSVELLSANSRLCEPSDISAPVDDSAADADEPRHDVSTGTSSFEKTSTWLLQQDNNGANVTETDVGLERVTQSNIYVSCKSSDMNLMSTVTASHSEPVMLQSLTLGNSNVSMARSSVTVIASTPSDPAFVDGPSSCISPPASQTISRQKTRQLRFSCAVPAVEVYPESKDAFPSNNDTETKNDTEEVDGEQWVTYNARNDVEELSMEDGASVANSNTSLSDTCNSSFMSSTEDLTNRDVNCTDEQSPPAAEVTPRMSTLRSQHSPGLRHRKRRTLNDSQRLASLSPARTCQHVKLAEEGQEDCGGNKICRECDALILASGGSLRQSADVPAAAVGELPRAPVSSDDDDDDTNSQLAPHTSPSKCRLLPPRHARRPCSARTMRLSEKFPGHSAAVDASAKDWGIRGEARRTNVRVMDVRLLESTGVSSADSDAEAARLSATKSASPSKVSNSLEC